jgi:hypothetical protein
MDIKKLDRKIRNLKRKSLSSREKKLIKRIRDMLGWIVGFER